MWRVWLLALGFVISGCVTAGHTLAQPANAQQEAATSNTTSGIEGETFGKAVEDEFLFSPEPRKLDGLEELHHGPIAVQVRMAQPADLADFGRITFGEGMTLMLVSTTLVGAAFGAAALPLLAGYAAWATIFFGGIVPGGFAFEKHRQSAIVEAISKVDFPQIAQTALQRRLDESILSAEPETKIIPVVERQVEVVVLSYGFVWSGVPDTACAFLRAQFRVTIPNFPTQRDWVSIDPWQRSADAPPAYCSYAEKLFAQDSALARQALSESAEILAAIVARRLEAGR